MSPFVGIRKSALGDGYEFCLPNGFDNFPDGDFNEVRDLFFKMYRTFRKFERDNTATSRFQPNKPDFQQDQDRPPFLLVASVCKQKMATIVYFTARSR